MGGAVGAHGVDGSVGGPVGGVLDIHGVNGTVRGDPGHVFGVNSIVRLFGVGFWSRFWWRA